MLATVDFASRVARAMAQLDQCNLCEHRCAADRRSGQVGPCKASAIARVFRHRVEYGEELQLIPSHLFYLSGCDLRCKFCIAEIRAFNPSIGAVLTAEFLTSALAECIRYRPRTLQWVGGEPTIHLPAILEAMDGQSNLPPIVWKTDLYGTPNAFDVLDGIVDVYVGDFKFGQNACANRLASVDRYWEVVTRNIRICAAQADLIVRHLLLPGHFNCCYRPIVRWIADNLPELKFSLRDGYLPKWQARHYDELNSTLDPATYRAAVRLANEHHLNLIR